MVAAVQGALHADQWVGLFIGVLALFTFFLYLLWRSTQKLWRASVEQGQAAQEAAEAAKLSASVAERALKAAQRAFLLVRETKATWPRGADTFLAQMIWENSGSTPALSVRMHVSKREAPDPLPEDFDFPDLHIVPEVARATYIAAKATTTQTVPIALSAGALAAAGKLHIYVWGWAEYEDIFDGRHRTEYCYQVVPVSVSSDEGKQKYRIEFHNYNRFNATDDSCLRPPVQDFDI